MTFSATASGDPCATPSAGADAVVSGTVFGVVLNGRAEREQLASSFHQPPYKAPPVAPVLYIKTPNTFALDGAEVEVPADPGTVQVGATLGLVIGKQTRSVGEEEARAHVAGITTALDLTLPHASYFRPAIRQRCRDGFLPINAVTTSIADADDLDAVVIATRIDGVEVHRWSTADLVRAPLRLLAEVSAFMTLSPGDVLLVGLPFQAPCARAGQSVEMQAAGHPPLGCRLVAETESPR